jgi:hypothetical protein
VVAGILAPVAVALGAAHSAQDEALAIQFQAFAFLAVASQKRLLARGGLRDLRLYQLPSQTFLLGRVEVGDSLLIRFLTGFVQREAYWDLLLVMVHIQVLLLREGPFVTGQI